MTKLTGVQVANEALHGWVYLLGGLQTRLHTPDFATGLAVVNAIGAAAGRLQHYPDVELRPTHVDIRLTSHDVQAVTAQDIRLAREISSIVTNAGLTGSEEPRQRWHLDVWLDPAEVETRIEAALAAGGSVVYNEHAPSFWVLADPDGNKVCLCTWQDRD